MKELVLMALLVTLPPGPWGGDGIVFQITSEGAQFELDCGHGTLKGPLEPDGKGAFAVDGTFTREIGPARKDGSDTRVARYSGKLDGTSLTLELWSETGDAVEQSWVLTRGREIRLHKCR